MTPMQVCLGIRLCSESGLAAPGVVRLGPEDTQHLLLFPSCGGHWDEEMKLKNSCKILIVHLILIVHQCVGLVHS